ncbi:Type 1 glutamine amidotransferase-like domain-containing protein [uncultured Tissierella sp.]|jgi:dipeptidase E|uniref:Type 1 glutamine amidotransferase-like domain-containing protein n=1 Tax=uncultured Tissierella sp. TaxID=448160 RepID=UPI0028063043|nr:Type 1 glutamine amidotransferase-like domain-containing protein [uncultured Tissierella sp.]MDU5083203.1 Type 1 glutamine amidotransferase-like domain-containing protein [Bacillota bacterium]
MGIIVAIGGGEISKLETWVIDEYIVKSAGKVNPKALFIPTASNEPQGYIDIFNDIYGKRLGCKIDVLYLINGNLSDIEIRSKILSADIIYVGGGDTVKMMEVWRSKKVDEYLKEAYEAGIVLSGLSAGSMCWFRYGHGDSDLSRNKDGWWDYQRIDGLSFIDAIHCPHYNEKGGEGFDEIMKTFEGIGIAIENNCALVIKDDKFKILKSDEKSNAYKLYKLNGIVYKQILDNYDLIDMNKLFER